MHYFDSLIYPYPPTPPWELPSLVGLLEKLGFSRGDAEALALWLSEDAVDTLYYGPPATENRELCLKVSPAQWGDGAKFLEWLNPPGNAPDGGAWIGEWAETPPRVEVSLVLEAHGDGLLVINLPTPWDPPQDITRDQVWAAALAWSLSPYSPVPHPLPPIENHGHNPPNS